MSKSATEARRALGRNALVMTAVGSAMGLMCASMASAGSVPGFDPSEAGTFDQQSGSPVAAGSPYFVSLPITATPPTLLKNSIALPYGGNSNAAAGLQNSQSSTQTKIIISSGTGVSQTDPGSSESPSSLEVYFEAEWFVDATGFGAPIVGNFSLPIGVKVGVNGSASVSVKVDWITQMAKTNLVWVNTPARKPSSTPVKAR